MDIYTMLHDGEQVEILLNGPHYRQAVRGYPGLPYKSETFENHLIKFPNDHKAIGTIVGEVGVRGRIYTSGRPKESVGVRPPQYFVFWDGWNISLPSWEVHKVGTVRRPWLVSLCWKIMRKYGYSA